MENASASSEDVALIYVRLIQQESQEAADIIEQIYADFGSQVALRAALIITLLKQETQPCHSIPNIRIYTYLLKDSPEAIPLLEQAISSCLESWRIPQSNKRRMEKEGRASEIASPALARDPFEDLLQPVRQHSPITAIKLEQICETYGYTAGCYAATALVWLGARIETFGYRTLTALTDKEIREFTYFQHMQGNEEAFALFLDMLEWYRTEQRPTTALDFSITHLALNAEQRADSSQAILAYS